MKITEMDEVIISENAFLYIQPSIMVLRFFGMAPITCEFKNSHYILKTSKWKILFYYAIAITLGVLGVFGLWIESNEYRQGGTPLRIKKDIDIYINAFDVLLIIFSVISTILSSPFKMKYLMNVLHCINKIDTILKEPIWKAKRDKKLSIFGIITAYVVSQSGIIFDGQFHIQQERNGSWLLYLRSYGTLFFFYSAILSQQLAYWSLVRYIKGRLKVMNDIMMNLVKNEDGYIDTGFWENKNGVQSRNIALNSTKERSLNLNMTVKDTTTDIIQLMMMLHEQVYICVHSINRFFDFPVLFILINCLIELVINPWALLNANEFVRGERLIFVMWILIHVVQLFLLIEPINGVLMEHKKTKLLIMQLLKATTNPEVKKKVEQFVMQYQLCSLEFTSVDMIVLRRSVYTVVSSAVTTYLVILIQIRR